MNGQRWTLYVIKKKENIPEIWAQEPTYVYVILWQNVRKKVYIVEEKLIPLNRQNENNTVAGLLYNETAVKEKPNRLNIPYRKHILLL